MNTEKQVFNKLFSNDKVELASQAYEFAITDDAKKIVFDFYTISNTGYSKTAGAINALREALAIHNKSIDESKKFDSLITKINQMAKDLGIDPANIQVLKDLKIGAEESKRSIANAKALEKAISLLS